MTIKPRSSRNNGKPKAQPRPSLNLADVYIFKKVAVARSFSAAARQLGVSASTISKQIRRLENDLGVVLINRSTRRLNLTEAGRTFDQYTSDIDKKVEQAADAVRSNDQLLEGTVALTMPTSLGASLMSGLTQKFQKNWPKLNLSVNFDDRFLDIIAGNFDLAIRVAQKLDNSSLISRRLCQTNRVLAASPGYLGEYGKPRNLADLENHRCIGIGSAVNSGTTWRLQDRGKVVDVPVTYAGSGNNDLAVILFACLDSGIVYLPEICIASEIVRGRLQIILPEFSDPEPYGIYAVYPHRNAANKVNALVDFMEVEICNMGFVERWVPSYGREPVFDSNKS